MLRFINREKKDAKDRYLKVSRIHYSSHPPRFTTQDMDSNHHACLFYSASVNSPLISSLSFVLVHFIY